MSSTPELVAVLDERLSQTEQPYAVVVGPASVNSISTAAASANASTITVSVVPPSNNMVLSRADVLLQYEARIVMTVTQNPAAPLGSRVCTPGLTFAPAPYFLHQLASTAQVTLNNATSSVPMSQSFAAIKRAIASNSVKSWNACGSKLAQLSSNDAAYATLASIIEDGASSLDENELGNGSFPITFCDATWAALPLGAPGVYSDGTVNVAFDAQARIVSSATTANTPFKVFIRVPITERVLVSPLAFDDPSEEVEGCSSLTSFQLQYSLQQLAVARAIQQCKAAEGSVLSNIAFDSKTFSFFNVLTTWSTPAVTAPRNPRTTLPYTAIQPYSSQGSGAFTTTTLTESQNFQMQSVQLPQIPDRIAIWVEVPASVYAANPQLAEQFFPISSISLSFANVGGLMSNFTPFQLYTASKRAGLQSFSYPAWQGQMCVGGANVMGVGSLLVLEPGRSFGLPAGCAPGQSGSWNISAQITCTGVGIACQPTVNLVCFYSGQLQLDELSGATSASMLGLSEAQVLDCMKSDEKVSQSSAHGIAAHRAIGGGWLGTAWKFAKGLARRFLPGLLRKAADHSIPAIADLATRGVAKGAEYATRGAQRGIARLERHLGEEGSGRSGGGRSAGYAPRLSLADRLAM